MSHSFFAFLINKTTRSVRQFTKLAQRYLARNQAKVKKTGKLTIYSFFPTVLKNVTLPTRVDFTTLFVGNAVTRSNMPTEKKNKEMPHNKFTTQLIKKMQMQKIHAIQFPFILNTGNVLVKRKKYRSRKTAASPVTGSILSQLCTKWNKL